MSYAREVIRVARNYGHELTAAMDVDRLEAEIDGYDAEIKELGEVIIDFPVDKANDLLDELERLREEKNLWYERWQHTSMAVFDLQDRLHRIEEAVGKALEELKDPAPDLYTWQYVVSILRPFLEGSE